MRSSTSSSERPGRWPRAALAGLGGRLRTWRWPWGLLFGLALFAGSDQAAWSSARWLALAARYTPPGPNGDPLRIEAELRRLPRAGAAAPILLLGSSQVREGLDCAAFDVHFPDQPCHNLAISAGSPLDVLAIANRFDRRAPRRVTVLGLFPKVLHLDPKESFVDAGTLRCVLGSGAWARLALSQWASLSGGLLQRASPTLRFKDALWDAHGVVRHDPRAAWRLELPAQPSRLLAGQAPLPPVYFERRLGRRDADARAPGAFTRAHELALSRFLEREGQRGNLALVIDFPTRAGYETTLPAETVAHWAHFLNGLRARADAVFVASGELGPLAPGDFQDFTHLSAAGRERVSRRVAARLAQAMQARPGG